MFFKISNKIETNYPCNYPLPNGNFLNCDLGWTQQGSVFYKGYNLEVADEQKIIAEMQTNSVPRYKGNFVLIVCNSTHTTITHSLNRCFPLQYDNTCVTNLETNLTPIWANSYV